MTDKAFIKTLSNKIQESAKKFMKDIKEGVYVDRHKLKRRKMVDEQRNRTNTKTN